MDNNYTPKTEIELESWMKNNCFNFNNYSINGNGVYEGFGIDKTGGHFIWYYTERGQKDNLKQFQTESEIIEFAFKQISADKLAKTHCIGFSSDKNKIIELKNCLLKMNIDFLGDEIPYYGIERPVYRIFVFGCDIQKTEHLKEKYWTEK